MESPPLIRRNPVRPVGTGLHTLTVRLRGKGLEYIRLATSATALINMIIPGLNQRGGNL